MSSWGNPATINTLDGVLKVLQIDKNYADACYMNHPTLGMLDKFERFGGKSLTVPVLYSRPQGASATFSNAAGNAIPSSIDAFTVTTVPYYATFSISGQSIYIDAADDMYTFADWMKTEADSSMETWADQMSTLIFGTGTGTLAYVSATSNVATKTITISNITAIVVFEVGMRLQAAATDGATPRLGTTLLAAINRATGQLSATSATWATDIPAIAAGDALLVQGNSNKCVAGFGAWNPATSPVFGTDSFFGVDRGSDPFRLAGLRYDATTGNGALTTEEAVLNALGLAMREGVKINRLAMNPYDLNQLQKTQQSRSIYERYVTRQAKNGDGPIATIGFEMYIINSMGVQVEVYADAKCPQGTCYGWEDGAYQLGSIGKAPRWLDQDGLWILRTTDDVYQGRIGFYGNLICRRTAKTLNITLPPAIAGQVM